MLDCRCFRKVNKVFTYLAVSIKYANVTDGRTDTAAWQAPLAPSRIARQKRSLGVRPVKHSAKSLFYYAMLCTA